MTTTVVIAQSAPGLLLRHDHPHSREICADVQEIRIHPPDPLLLGRGRDGTAWLICAGPRPVHVSYTIPNEGGVGRRIVGPRHDYVMPGAAKEIGIGRRVWWRVAVV